MSRVGHLRQALADRRVVGVVVLALGVLMLAAGVASLVIRSPSSGGGGGGATSSRLVASGTPTSSAVFSTAKAPPSTIQPRVPAPSRSAHPAVVPPAVGGLAPPQATSVDEATRWAALDAGLDEATAKVLVDLVARLRGGALISAAPTSPDAVFERMNLILRVGQVYLKGNQLKRFIRTVFPAPQLDVIEPAPSRSIVADPDVRQRMLDTGLPWRVMHKPSGIECLLVPPGEFEYRVDSIKTEVRRIPEPFYMGRYEVTHKQWRKVVALWSNVVALSVDDRLQPIENIPPNRMDVLCQFSGFRLPTCEEWQYACGAGVAGEPTGELHKIAWYGGEAVHEVGSKASNPWGFHDMIGNVSEVTLDWGAGSRRQFSVMGGGSADKEPLRTRSGLSASDSESGARGVGFRVVIEVPSKPGQIK